MQPEPISVGTTGTPVVSGELDQEIAGVSVDDPAAGDDQLPSATSSMSIAFSTWRALEAAGL